MVMNVIEVPASAWKMLPPAPDKCPVCAWAHEVHDPHNAQSLFYQTRFLVEHGRAPTWTDAMAHCPRRIQRLWRQQLRAVMTQAKQPIPADLVEQLDPVPTETVTHRPEGK